jgi:hypothetical protein
VSAPVRRSRAAFGLAPHDHDARTLSRSVRQIFTNLTNVDCWASTTGREHASFRSHKRWRRTNKLSVWASCKFQRRKKQPLCSQAAEATNSWRDTGGRQPGRSGMGRGGLRYHLLVGSCVVAGKWLANVLAHFWRASCPRTAVAYWLPICFAPMVCTSSQLIL